MNREREIGGRGGKEGGGEREEAHRNTEKTLT